MALSDVAGSVRCYREVSAVPIMIVDDTIEVLRSIKDSFSMCGFKRITAYPDPRKAYDAVVEGERPRFIITDFLMPDINGAELLAMVAAVDSSIIGIVLTADVLSAKEYYPKAPVFDKSPGYFREITEYIRQRILDK